MTRGSRTTSASAFHAPSHARAAVTAASMSISAISSASSPSVRAIPTASASMNASP